MSGLPRDVIKWLQSLGLKHPYLNPQWDLANGVLISEILGKHGKLYNAASIFKGNSLEMKVHNWALLKKVMEKMDLVIPDSLVEASMHCKHGAGKALLIKLFEQLTHWQVPNRQDFNYSKFFTDHSYDDDSPLYTRSTAVSAIRANFKDTEQRLNKDLQTQKAKSMAILKEHNRQVTLMKESHPEKFCHVEKMAEVALRRTPPPSNQVHLHPDCIVNEEESQDIVEMTRVNS